MSLTLPTKRALKCLIHAFKYSEHALDKEEACTALVKYTYFMIPPLSILYKNHCRSEIVITYVAYPQLRVIETDEKSSGATGPKLAYLVSKF